MPGLGKGIKLSTSIRFKRVRVLLSAASLCAASAVQAQVTLGGEISSGTADYGCVDLQVIEDFRLGEGAVLTGIRNIEVLPGVTFVLDGSVNFSGTWTIGSGSTVSGAGSAVRTTFPGTACAAAVGPVGPVYPAPRPVPALGEWTLAALATVLAGLGWRARRRGRGA